VIGAPSSTTATCERTSKPARLGEAGTANATLAAPPAGANSDKSIGST